MLELLLVITLLLGAVSGSVGVVMTATGLLLIQFFPLLLLVVGIAALIYLALNH